VTSSSPVAPTPRYAVIFVSQRTDGDNGYAATLAEIDRIGRAQPGFVAIESARNAEGKGITVVFYDSLEAIEAWRKHPDHRAAKQRGRESWYRSYQIYLAQVEWSRRWEKAE
jgi:heme-degrading monooxygenase HmoA